GRATEPTGSWGRLTWLVQLDCFRKSYKPPLKRARHEKKLVRACTCPPGPFVLPPVRPEAETQDETVPAPLDPDHGGGPPERRHQAQLFRLDAVVQCGRVRQPL